MKNVASIGTLVALLLASSLATAQQGIAVSPQPFVGTLPIAPAAASQPTEVTSVVLAPPVASFEVRASDRNVRDVLSRWAKAAGWVHEPAHWALDKDFPVAAAAGPEIFGPEFKGAVRVLLSSTELTDRPVQPCFYTNHVVRVIPKAEFCDKTVQ